MTQNYDFQSNGWSAGAPATGVEQVFGLDAGGNLASMPHHALRRGGTYFSDPMRFPKWRRAMGRVRSGSGRARFLCLGDSTTAGGGAGSSGNVNYVGAKAKSWPTKIASIFAANALPAQTSSFFCDNAVTSNNSVALSSYDPRINLSSGWAVSPNAAAYNTLGGSVLASTTSGSVLTFTPAETVDTFVVLYVTNSGNGVVNAAIDGGSSTAINTGSPATIGVGSQVITASSPGAHSLTLTTASASSVFIWGVIAYNSTVAGVDVLNAGMSGYTSGQVNQSGAAYYTVPALKYVAPDLTIINLGINDWRTGVSLTTFSSNVQALITAAQVSGDVALVVPVPSQLSGSYGNLTTQQLQGFQQALYSLANANTNPGGLPGIPTLDLFYLYQSGAAMNALGEMFDQLHPNPTGYGDISQEIGQFLLAA